MDEPTSALDPLARREVLNTVRTIADGGTTVLLVTHDIGSVARIADQVIVMYLGGVVECGPAAEILGEPVHPYTKALIGCVPSVEVMKPLVTVPGEVAKDVSALSGCRFHPRCPDCIERCTIDEPKLKRTGRSSEVACHVAR
jgi:oligopeptide/dipeptide ABC transporter ATP-binding protein